MHYSSGLYSSTQKEGLRELRLKPVTVDPPALPQSLTSNLEISQFRPNFVRAPTLDLNIHTVFPAFPRWIPVSIAGLAEA